MALRAEADFERTLAQLVELLRYPAISCEPEWAGDVNALAARVRDNLAALGMDRARFLELDGAMPSVAAERLRAGPDAPTVLIYGHCHNLSLSNIS